jgi:hypothetical protein
VSSPKETIANACKYMITGRSATLQYCMQEGENRASRADGYSNYENHPQQQASLSLSLERGGASMVMGCGLDTHQFMFLAYLLSPQMKLPAILYWLTVVWYFVICSTRQKHLRRET